MANESLMQLLVGGSVSRTSGSHHKTSKLQSSFAIQNYVARELGNPWKPAGPRGRQQAHGGNSPAHAPEFSSPTLSGDGGPLMVSVDGQQLSFWFSPGPCLAEDNFLLPLISI